MAYFTKFPPFLFLMILFIIKFSFLHSQIYQSCINHLLIWFNNNLHQDGQGSKVSNCTASWLALLFTLCVSCSTINSMGAGTISWSQLTLTAQIRASRTASTQSFQRIRLLFKSRSTGLQVHIFPTWHSLCYRGRPLRRPYKEQRFKTLGK